MRAAALGTPRGRATLGWRRLVWLAAVAGPATLAVGFGGFVAGLDRIERPPARHAGGIVALTGGAERVSDALALLVDGRADRLLISGVNRSTSAADITRGMPRARRLLGCCIDLGYEATNTIGNARETRLWARTHAIRSLIVVTSNYHMPRALVEMGDAIPGVELIPFPVVSDRSGGDDLFGDAQRWRLMATEYLKYLAVLARARLWPAAPYGAQTASLPAAHLPQRGACSSCARSSSTSSSTPS